CPRRRGRPRSRRFRRQARRRGAIRRSPRHRCSRHYRWSWDGYGSLETVCQSRAGGRPSPKGCRFRAIVASRQAFAPDPVQSRVTLPAADPPDQLQTTQTISVWLAPRTARSASMVRMSLAQTLRRDWLSDIRADILSGIVVALALIPEAIGFSIIAGVEPRVGLYASVVIAIVISFAGGRPAMISAATAATAVLFGALVREHGLQYLLAATILAGIIQIGAGWLRIGYVMRFVSRSVMTGFVNALAILIFMAQLPELLGVTWQTYA